MKRLKKTSSDLEKLPFRLILVILKYKRFVIQESCFKDMNLKLVDFYGRFSKDPTRSIFLIFSNVLTAHVWEPTLIPSKGLENLVICSLSSFAFSPRIELPFLKKMKSLRTLDGGIFHHHQISDLKDLSITRTLQDVSINLHLYGESYERMKNLEFLNLFGNLRKLCIWNQNKYPIHGDLHLPYLVDLISLGKFPELSLKYVPKLEGLRMLGCDIKRNMMQSIIDLPLKKVEFHDSIFEDISMIKDLNYGKIQTLKFIRRCYYDDDLQEDPVAEWLDTNKVSIERNGFVLEQKGCEYKFVKKQEFQ